MLRRSFLIPIRHRTKDVPTSVGSFSFEVLSKKVRNNNFDYGKIPAGYSHRPDLIADLFFEDSSNWWVFMAANGIVDPFEELNLNDIVELPLE